MMGGAVAGERDTYRVPFENFAALQERIGALAKRAKRLGMPPIALEVLSDEEERAKDIRGVVQVRRWRNVRVTGEAPVLGGWHFVATLQHIHDAEADNGPMAVVRTVPGESLPEQYRSAEFWNCDHCGTRRWRRDTYVVRHVETSEYKQIGSNCLKDFLGHANPHAVAAYAELLIHTDEALKESVSAGMFRGRDFFDLEQYLAFVAAEIRTSGWLSRSEARARCNMGAATADRAIDAMFDEDRVVPEPQDEKLAQETLVWARSLRERDPRELSEYLYNVSVVTAAPTIEPRSAGIAASAVYSWMRECEREIERRARASQHADSQYVGAPGGRVELTATLLFLRYFESDNGFGGSTLTKWITPDGNLLVWFASGERDDLWNDYDKGVLTCRLRATVKRHEERDGVRQTVLTRGKVLDREVAPQ